ncbi:MAG: hypothetical protein ABUL73_01485 [Alphaproteobacteria bacterium]
MRIHVFAAAALAASLAFTPVYADGEHHTQLSQCMHNALIGAGVGAAIGALQHSRHHVRNAALGAAVGGAATYGVCQLLSHREESRVENDYQRSLSSNSSVHDSWNADNGAHRSLNVAQPTAASDAGSQCRHVSATVRDSDGSHALPPETFCRNSSGQWVPA